VSLVQLQSISLFVVLTQTQTIDIRISTVVSTFMLQFSRFLIEAGNVLPVTCCKLNSYDSTLKSEVEPRVLKIVLSIGMYD
jgi:hypothetical protein